MESITTIVALRDRIRDWRAAGVRIGLVPTMGYLHEGHLRLVDEARRRTDRIVVSIFVNPLQFSSGEDLGRYPRDVARDTALLAARSADLVFAPTPAEMYPAPPAIRVEPGPLGARWEGAVRPGHFAGVLTVVAKLFNLVGPDLACFGQKDIQQATLIRRMVQELDWPIEIAVVATVREADGLALSSRNVYLTPDDRRRARILSRALRAAVVAWSAGETDPRSLEAQVKAELAREASVAVDYVAIVDPIELAPVSVATADTIVALAARVGSTRLIDNVILGQSGLGPASGNAA